MTEGGLSVGGALATGVVSFWREGRIDDSNTDGDCNGDFYKS
jgi:hypothetical protein